MEKEIPLCPPSLGGSLTDRGSEEQQEDEVMSGTIDCQPTSKVHYTDRRQPWHVDLHSNNVLITANESLGGTNLVRAFPASFSFSFSEHHVSLSKAQRWGLVCQSDTRFIRHSRDDTWYYTADLSEVLQKNAGEMCIWAQAIIKDCKSVNPMIYEILHLWILI